MEPARGSLQYDPCVENGEWYTLAGTMPEFRVDAVESLALLLDLELPLVALGEETLLDERRAADVLDGPIFLLVGDGVTSRVGRNGARGGRCMMCIKPLSIALTMRVAGSACAIACARWRSSLSSVI